MFKMFEIFENVFQKCLKCCPEIPRICKSWICNGSASNTTSAPQLAASGKPQLVHVLARIAREETSCNEEVPELDQLPIAKMRKEFAPREEPGS